MHHRIFLCAAFLLFSCGCRNSSLSALGETIVSTVAEKPTDDEPVMPIVTHIEAKPASIATPKTDPCARAMCPMIYCSNSLPAIPSQGICCPRCVKNPSCNVTACPKYKCSAGIQPANLTAGECCDRCAPVPTMTSFTKTKPSKKQTSESSSGSSSSSESDSSNSSGSSSDSDESHGKLSRKHRRLPCFIHKFKGKSDDSKIIRALKKSLARCRRRSANRPSTGERLLMQ